MRILIVGNGGREHALLWKLVQDAPRATFYATRPNPGMATLADPVDISPSDVDSLVAWATGKEITLTIVGPEIPLAGGITDVFRRHGLPIFGPSAGAARIESSKAFSKKLMAELGVPTAAHATFTRWSEAEAYIRESPAPLVVKASGLAAGKGAIVCGSTEEALEAARDMLEGETFGAAGAEVVVEEFLDGEELSVFGITDGREVVVLLPSQDHKRIGEGDTGSNTGGMGAYAPVPWAPVPFHASRMEDEILDTIYFPVLDALEHERTPFRGLLYAGLMKTAEGLKVIEFNCRFGDPETQAVLPLMESSLLDLMIPVARGGSIAHEASEWRGGAALNTVLASGGYPESYRKGEDIEIPPELLERDDVLVFHAGTKKKEGRLITDGGRVLSVVGLGADLEEAHERSLAAADQVRFEGKTFRRDIGWRALSSPKAERA